jgi:hypothetical protein
MVSVVIWTSPAVCDGFGLAPLLGMTSAHRALSLPLGTQPSGQLVIPDGHVSAEPAHAHPGAPSTTPILASSASGMLASTVVPGKLHVPCWQVSGDGQSFGPAHGAPACGFGW